MDNLGGYNREKDLRDFAKELENNKDRYVEKAPTEFPHFTTSTTAIPEACRGCSNWGKGVCFCTLGSMIMY